MVSAIIISLMPAIGLITVAAFLNAVMDSMEHHPDFWPFTPFWNTHHPKNDQVKRIFSYPLDGWHLAKFGMLGCLVSGVAVPSTLDLCWHVAVLWVWWVLVFNLFYNKVFR